MATWRVQLKPDSANGISYKDLLEFCKSNQIIGVGWYLVEGHTDDYETLRNEVYSMSLLQVLSKTESLGSMKFLAEI